MTRCRTINANYNLVTKSQHQAVIKSVFTICVLIAIVAISGSQVTGANSLRRNDGDGNIIRNTKMDRKPLDIIRRLYGDDNASVRAAISKLETTSTHYWRTGHRENREFRIKYKNHPYEKKTSISSTSSSSSTPHILDSSSSSSSLNNRFLEEGNTSTDTTDVNTNSTDADEEPSLFKPMRILFYTAALDQQRNQLNGGQIDFIKNKILPRTGEFWSNALHVVPVVDSLIIQPGELSNRQYCGDSEFTTVPNEHMSVGIKDTDLVLYVSGTPSTRFCGPTTLAVAVACNFDQFDRPTAGAINFCLDTVELDPDGTAPLAIEDDNVDVAIHEAAHVLGMSSNSYKYFYDSDTGEPRTKRPFIPQTVTCVDGQSQTLTMPSENTLKFSTAANGQRYASIVTPKVATVTRNQFNCQSMEGAPLENQPTGAGSCTGDHWEERLFYPESLSGVISPTTNILSPLTLALMEDSGWYVAKYSRSKVSPWGLSVGCEFVNEPCIVKDPNGQGSTVPSYGRGFFCTESSERGCSPTHLYKMACTVLDYSLFFNTENPPSQFQYFTDPGIGGPRQTDYCPVFGTAYGGLDPHELDCRDPDNADLINLFDEEYGPDSKCFETSYGEARCYHARCFYEDYTYRFRIGEETYICEQDFQVLEVKATPGNLITTTITCPRISSVCPDILCPANCAGRGICNYAAIVNETQRPQCECFDKNDTSPACSESLTISGEFLSDPDSLLGKAAKSFFDSLVAVFMDPPSKWSSASWAWASALFVILLLFLLCIFTTLCGQRKNKRMKAYR